MIRPTGICLMLSLIAPAAAYAQTESDAQPMSAGGAGTVAQSGSYEVFFDLDSARLDSDALATITSVANAYRATGQANLTVSGHTDTTGSAEYNQGLAQRRAEAVTQELVRLGVPQDVITQRDAGENDLLVQTGEGVPERRNRRVEIALEQPQLQPEAPVAATVMPPAISDAATEVADAVDRGRFSLGLYYGANLLDEGDDSGEDTHHVTHLAGLNLSFDYLVTDWLNLSLEQAGFYNFDTDDDGFGGRSVAGVDLVFPTSEGGFGTITNFLPYVGLNIGGIYGSGLDDDFIWGPEIGLNIGPIVAKIAYDMPFDRDMDEGIISTTVGVGITF
jgi:hypothetical protein